MPARFVGRIFIQSPPEGLTQFAQPYWVRIFENGFSVCLYPSDPMANRVFSQYADTDSTGPRAVEITPSPPLLGEDLLSRAHRCIPQELMQESLHAAQRINPPTMQ